MPLLEVRHLVKEFSRTRGWFAPPSVVRAVDDVSFTIERGRNVRARRRIRQRQDHHRPMHPAADRADVGRGAVQGRGRAGLLRDRACARRAATCRSSFRIRTPRSIRACGSATSSKSRSSSTASGAKPERRARVAELFELVGLDPVAARAVSAPVQRRPAPAHRPRARARAESVAHHRRRTGIGARRLGAGAGHQPADGSAGAPEADLPLHRARSQARAPHLQPRRGDVSGKDRRDGGDRALFAAPAHPYTRALLSAIPMPDPARRAPAHRARSRVVQPRGAAARSRRRAPGGGLTSALDQSRDCQIRSVDCRRAEADESCLSRALGVLLDLAVADVR